MSGHFVARIVKSSSKRVLRATVIISRKIPQHNSIEPLGCGVLLLLQGEFFLVTAAHLLNAQMWLDLVIPGTNGVMISLQGELCTSHLNNGERSNIDFAFIRFYPKMHQYLTIYDPITETEVLMNHSTILRDHYLLAGYPVRKIKKKTGRREFHAESFGFLTHSVPQKRLHKHGFNQNLHALVAFQRKVQSFDNGSIYTAVNPQGISGSGLFFIPEFNQNQLDNPSVFLVGIMIENHQDKGILAALRIDIVIEVIRWDCGLKMTSLPFTKAEYNLGRINVSDYMEIADYLDRLAGIEPPPLDSGVNRIMKPTNLIRE